MVVSVIAHQKPTTGPSGVMVFGEDVGARESSNSDIKSLRNESLNAVDVLSYPAVAGAGAISTGTACYLSIRAHYVVRRLARRRHLAGPVISFSNLIFSCAQPDAGFPPKFIEGLGTRT